MHETCMSYQPCRSEVLQISAADFKRTNQKHKENLWDGMEWGTKGVQNGEGLIQTFVLVVYYCQLNVLPA